MNTKTEVFWRKNRKTDLKNSQNHRTENPNAPSLTTSEFENLSCHHNKQWLTDMKNSWFFAFVQSLPIYHVEGFSIYQEMKTTLNWRRLSFPFIFEVNITLLLFESSRYDCVITVFLPLEYIYILQTPMVRVIGSWEHKGSEVRKNAFYCLIYLYRIHLAKFN